MSAVRTPDVKRRLPARERGAGSSRCRTACVDPWAPGWLAGALKAAEVTVEEEAR
jgi:hypothetical protein